MSSALSVFRNIFKTAERAISKIPSDSEREMIRGEITKEFALLEVEFDKAVMSEATLRYQKDLESGSLLNRHIRAIIMLIYTVIVIVLPFINKVPLHIMDLYSTIAMLIYGFYFGGKTFEKTAEIFKLVKK